MLVKDDMQWDSKTSIPSYYSLYEKDSKYFSTPPILLSSYLAPTHEANFLSALY